jgi:hypothetical protein
MAGRHGLAADGQPAVEIAAEGQQDGGLDPFAFIWQGISGSTHSDAW